jgi:hypothetical protein
VTSVLLVCHVNTLLWSSCLFLKRPKCFCSFVCLELLAGLGGDDWETAHVSLRNATQASLIYLLSTSYVQGKGERLEKDKSPCPPRCLQSSRDSKVGTWIVAKKFVIIASNSDWGWGAVLMASIYYMWVSIMILSMSKFFQTSQPLWKVDMGNWELWLRKGRWYRA